MRSSAGISLIVFAFSIGTSSFVSGQRPRPVRRRRQKQQLLRIPSDNRNLVVSSALYNEEKEKLSSLELLRGLVEDVVLFSSSSMSMSMQQRLLKVEEEEDDELLIHHRDLDSFLSSIDLSMSMSMDMSTSIISSSSSCTVPPPFDTNTDIKIHVIMNILTGEYFDLLVDGMITQGLKMGDEVDINFSDDPNETQSDLILKALENGATAIITVDGGPDTLCGSIVKAIDAGVPVVSFDFEGAVTCSDVGHLLTAQSDIDMAETVLTYAASNVILEEEGDMNTTTAATVAVGYVNDLNYQPLQNRNFVWEVDSEKYGWKQEFFVKDAASYATPEELQGAIMEQLSNTTADNIRFIYAPWDHLAINTLKAIEKSGLNADVDVYGADINNEDIKAMIQPNSAWKATAGGHPKMIGAAILRMSLLQMANQIMKEEKQFIQILSFLFTQEFLLKENVTNLSDLLDAMPELRLKDIASACWIDPIG
jgi:simple sugar transport system substrate-binding protein